MEIKVPTSKVFLEKGKSYSLLPKQRNANLSRFGWVNASYVYGLSFIPMHMKRALGTLTPYETFAKATEIKLGWVEDTTQEGSDESRPDSADEADAT